MKNLKYIILSIIGFLMVFFLYILSVMTWGTALYSQIGN